jgi:pyruvate, water dikinase
MEKIYKFDRSQSADILAVGEKAFWLQKLWQQNIPTISGFVLTSSIYRELLTDFPEFYHPVNIDNYKILQSTARQSRQVTFDAHLDADLFAEIYREAIEFHFPILILRPSFVPLENLTTPHFYDSQICWCQQKSIESGIKQIYADLFSAKSLFYWQRQGISIDRVGLAILIQPLQTAIVSGTVKVERNTIELQATFGWGHSIMAGEVIPDRYLLARNSNQLQEKILGKKITAYYPNKSAKQSKTNDRCLQKISLDDRQQTEFALNSQQYDRLIEQIESIEKLDLIGDRNYTFAWTLATEDETTASNFYLTEFFLEDDRVKQKYDRPSVIIQPDINADIANNLTGLAVSSGKVRSKAHIIAIIPEESCDIPKNCILVVPNLSTPSLPLLKQAVGVIAETGGMTSHIAIVARELGIPAVLGVTDATKILPQGEMLSLDGDNGEIRILNATETENDNTPLNSPTPPINTKPFATNYPIATQLYVNLSQPQSSLHPTIAWVDGLGVLRSELMLLDLFSTKPVREWVNESEKNVFIEYLRDSICHFAKTFMPRPIFYRSLDWCFPGMGINPFLGRRGTYNYLIDPALFDLELQALIKAIDRGYHNINLILPFVRSIEEFNFCRRRIEQIGLRDRQSFQLWIMAEVPSVIFQLEEYVKAGVQGIAIGSNDLTQLLLGIDRESSDIGKHFNILHPAMLKALEQLITTANNLNIPATFLASNATEDPHLITLLIEWGINAISVELDAAERTYRTIARAEQKIILNRAIGF